MTSITVDFGDGTAISYVNISSIEDGVKHVYNKVGIYQVSATASNSLGLDRVVLYLHVSCESEKLIDINFYLFSLLVVVAKTCIFFKDGFSVKEFTPVLNPHFIRV